MRKSAGLLLVLAAGSYTFGASAQQLRGSDTLENLTKQLITACSGTSGLTYIGGGSGAGETGLINGTQAIAPMSRPLNCTTTGSRPNSREYTIALDGVTIFADSEQTEKCGGGHSARGQMLRAPFSVPVTNTTPGGEPAPSFSDLGNDAVVKLRQIYFGLPGATGTAGQDCSNATRAGLYGNYKSLFSDACASGSGQSNTCTGIKHAFRRGDTSGTTDAFRGFVGAGTVAFCNGNDQQDKDPLRATCADSEQVCSADNKLGFVLPIVVPEGDNVDTIYPVATCPNGRFRSGAAPFNDSTSCFRNPITNANVWPSVFAKCPSPVTVPGAACLNGFTVDEFGGNQFVGRTAIDARVHNLRVRRPGSASAAGNFVAFANGNEVTAAFYRINSTAAGKFPFRAANSTNICRDLDSTRHIGCLVQAPNSSCSIGYAGGEAGAAPINAESLAINGVDPTTATIGNLSYPFTRKLLLNTLNGFDSGNAAQDALAACFQNPGLVNPLVTANNFVVTTPSTRTPCP